MPVSNTPPSPPPEKPVTPIQTRGLLIKQLVKDSLSDATSVAIDFFKVLIPLIVALKILTELGWIPYLALPLQPLMELVGLPADLGIAWATGILVNVYSAMLIFATLLPLLPTLSAEQTTVFCTMLLIAHSLPVEGRIAQQCGVSFIATCVTRVLLALSAGLILHYTCGSFDLLQAPANILFEPKPSPPGLGYWVFGELRNLVMIYVIIFCVMLLQRILTACNATRFLEFMLNPLLRLMGLRPAAAMTIVVGFATGLIYSSGIVIKESRSGALTRHEVFTVLMLLSLAHALIEDTLLMVMIGGHIVGVLFLRLGLALLTGALINAVYTRIGRHS